MAIRQVHIIFIGFYSFVCCISCTSEANQKKAIIKQMTNPICEGFDNDKNTISQPEADLILALINGLINNGAANAEAFCNCFNLVVGGALMEKFTVGELQEIQKDKIKQLMTMYRIVENKGIQNQLTECDEEDKKL
ncbi:MAG: hypothetical protein IPH74_12950 [Bacteroidetes bacterium]|nr:hypothetical protein [Bacteroidota bacterium]